MEKSQKHQTVSSETTSETVTPAGGETDGAVVNDFVRALQANRSEITRVIEKPRPYTRIALEAAIPTAVVMGGLVGAVAVLTVIDNKWGNGSRVQQLIDKGWFDGVAPGNIDQPLMPSGS